jgi:hypothetical protein
MADIERPRVTPEWPTQQPQRQDSLADQLRDLHRIAARYGMYDAADWLWKRMQAAGVRHPAGSATPTLTAEQREDLAYEAGLRAGSATPTGDDDDG